MEETVKLTAVRDKGGLSYSRWTLLALVSVVGIVVIALLLRELRDAARLASCRPYSVTWVTQDYSKANAGMFPPLSSTPGRLMFVEGIEGELFPSGLRRDFICEFDYQDSRAVTEVPGAPLDDWSFVYLGYVIENQVQLELFAEAYKRIIAEKGDFTQDIDVASGLGNCGTDKLHRLRSWDNLLEILPCLRGRLDSIPLVIEWPENHRGPVAKVVSLEPDSRGEAMAFPGEWPMTEAAIRVLRELDALGTDPSAPSHAE